MDAAAAQDLAEARRIVLQQLKGLPVRVFLFGSRARGDARRASDVDIAIDAGAGLSPELLAGIRDALDESGILLRADVVDLARAPAELRDQVYSEGIEWTG